MNYRNYNTGLFFFLLIILLIALPASGKERFENHLKWRVLPALPPAPGQDFQPGLAAPFSGASNGMLLVAGGCNFPDKAVWEGGAKVYYSDAFALEHKGDGEYVWHSGYSIPYRAAYGVSISTPDGVICIGGNNGTESFSSVFLMKWDPSTGQIITENLPSLPFPMTQMAGALVENRIYLAGGLVDGKPSNAFLSLDLSKRQSRDLQWEILENYPGPARLQAVAVGQNEAEQVHFYLFSGSSYPEDREDPYILTDGLEYNPRTKNLGIPAGY